MSFSVLTHVLRILRHIGSEIIEVVERRRRWSVEVRLGFSMRYCSRAPPCRLYTLPSTHLPPSHNGADAIFSYRSSSPSISSVPDPERTLVATHCRAREPASMVCTSGNFHVPFRISERGR